MVKHLDTHIAYLTNEDPKWDASNIETGVCQNDSIIITQVLTRIKDRKVFEFILEPEESFIDGEDEDGEWAFQILSYQDGDRPSTQKEFDKALVSDKEFNELLKKDNFRNHWDLFRKVSIRINQEMDKAVGLISEKDC